MTRVIGKIDTFWMYHHAREVYNLQRMIEHRHHGQVNRPRHTPSRGCLLLANGAHGRCGPLGSKLRRGSHGGGGTEGEASIAWSVDEALRERRVRDQAMTIEGEG
jgi:hypothetical protein